MSQQYPNQGQMPPTGYGGQQMPPAGYGGQMGQRPPGPGQNMYNGPPQPGRQLSQITIAPE